jgi:hypothetical protein
MLFHDRAINMEAESPTRMIHAALSIILAKENHKLSASDLIHRAFHLLQEYFVVTFFTSLFTDMNQVYRIKLIMQKSIC